jgi:RecB family endonuclease NucS
MFRWSLGDLESSRPVRVSANPTLKEAKELVAAALESGKATLIVGSCDISYKGRASSTLGAGERIIFITRDKALLIHRAFGYKPVNWQPAGCKFRVELRPDDRLEVTGVRMKPLESVRIIFGRIYSVLVLDLSDESDILMYGSELEMKKAILYDPDIIESGFTPIKSEKETPTGFVDIFGKDKNGNGTIIEIKKGKATRDAALQLARYVEPFRKQDHHIRGILVAEGLARGTERSIASLNLEYKRLSIKKCIEIIRRVSRDHEEAISDYF